MQRAKDTDEVECPRSVRPRVQRMGLRPRSDTLRLSVVDPEVLTAERSPSIADRSGTDLVSDAVGGQGRARKGVGPGIGRASAPRLAANADRCGRSHQCRRRERYDRAHRGFVVQQRRRLSISGRPCDSKASSDNVIVDTSGHGNTSVCSASPDLKLIAVRGKQSIEVPAKIERTGDNFVIAISAQVPSN